MTRTYIKKPDPQRAYLDALEMTIETATHRWSEDDRHALWSDRPQSHLFTGDYLEAGYDDPDEYREVVNMVGDKDIEAKIRWAERTIDSLNEMGEEVGDDE